MAEVRLRNRSRLRRKEVAALSDGLSGEWGLAQAPFSEEEAVDAAEWEGRRVFLFENEAVAFEHEGRVAPTVRGLLRWPASRRKVTVDMGAVRFVTNGADIMTPGITAADEGLVEGDLVWIGEERHGKPLAIGQALVDAAGLKGSTKGRGVKSLHFLGDKLWGVGHEEEAEGG